MLGKRYVFFTFMAFLLALAMPFVSAGYISITSEIAITVSGQDVMLDITMSNSGDEVSKDVFIEAEVLGIEKSSDVIASVFPGGKSSVDMAFGIDQPVPEDFPIIIKTHYSDNNNYPFSKADVVTYGTAGEGVDVESETIVVSSEKETKIGIVTSEGVKVTGYQLYYPDELDVSYESFDEWQDSSDKDDIGLQVARGSSLDGSSYNMFLVMHYTKDGVHDFFYAPISVVIEPVKKALGIIKTIALSLALILLISVSILLLSGIGPKSLIRYYKSHITWGSILAIIVFLAIFAFILSYITPDLIFSKTITTGGDTASHYYTAQFMKDFLLPNLEVSGWMMGNYGGFPVLQFYFPFPFVLMAALSQFLSLQVAFKIITLLGTFLLPFAAYFLFRKFGFKKSISLLPSIFMLPFLFMEANSMWGGNIPSTLAGEFSYSLGLAFTLMYFGTLYKGIKERRWFVLNVLMLVLVGLSHVYTLLFAGFSSIFFVFAKCKDEVRYRARYLLGLAAISFLALGFWIIPLVSKIGYTTPYADFWEIGSLSSVVPMILLPFVCFLVLFVPIFLRWKEMRHDDRIFFLLFALMVAFIFFWIAKRMGVVNIRFVPFMQVIVLLLSALALGIFLSKFRKAWTYVALILILPSAFLFVSSNVDYIDDWAVWNYKGFESKSQWDTLQNISAHLNGSVDDPRVVFEHSSANNAFGSTRVFESLPLFSGRSTLEGLYMQSSPSAPFIFYIQSLVSKEKSCPFGQFGCSSLDMGRAFPRLEMFSVSQLIIRSDEAKDMISKDDRYMFEESFGLYDIYSLVDADTEYVYVPDNEPVFIDTKSPQYTSYLWFIDDSMISIPLVFDERLAREKGLKTISSLAEISAGPITEECHVSSFLEEESISFTTDCVGLPHIVKVSYFPNWKVSGADSVYMVSPSSMLVYPSEEEVVLEYKSHISDIVGLIFTFIAAILLILIIRKPRDGFIVFVRRSYDRLFFLIRKNLLIFIIMLLSFIFLYIFLSHGSSADPYVKDIAVKTSSYPVCEHAGSFEEDCYIDVASVSADYNLCIARVSSERRDSCLYDAALANGQPSACSYISDGSIKQRCEDDILGDGV